MLNRDYVVTSRHLVYDNFVRLMLYASTQKVSGIARLLLRVGFQHILICDRLGILDRYRLNNMNWAKVDIARQTNPESRTGTLSDAMQGANVVIGLFFFVEYDYACNGRHNGETLHSFCACSAQSRSSYSRRRCYRSDRRPDYPNLITNALVLPGVFRVHPAAVNFASSATN